MSVRMINDMSIKIMQNVLKLLFWCHDEHSSGQRFQATYIDKGIHVKSVMLSNFLYKWQKL